MLPLVSVLMPVYNHEKYVEKAIKSVIQQTYPNIELIVINDGSTDQSDAIIKQLLQNHKFTYLYQNNQGLVKTLNTLKSLVNGKYVSILASDDIFHETKIAKLVEYMEHKPELAMVYSNMYLIDLEGQLIGKIKDGGKEGDIFEELLYGNFFINSLTTLIKKEVYDRFTYQDCYIEDLQMWLKIAKNYEIGYLNDYLAYYRTNNNTSLSANLFKMQKAEYEIISQYSDEPIYPTALNAWNLRWFGSFAKCDKKYAVQTFLLKILKSRNFFKKDFYKGLIKLIVPCVLFRRA